jgi:hypothetical protein
MKGINWTVSTFNFTPEKSLSKLLNQASYINQSEQ